MKREDSTRYSPGDSTFPPHEAADWVLFYDVLEFVSLTALFEASPPSVRGLQMMRAMLPDLSHEPPPQLKARIGSACELELGTFPPAEAQELLEKAAQLGLPLRSEDASHRGYMPLHVPMRSMTIIEDEEEAERSAAQMIAAGVRVIVDEDEQREFLANW